MEQIKPAEIIDEEDSIKQLEARLKALKKEAREQNKSGKARERSIQSKGIQTMFRTTLTNLLRLSLLADRKANLMISINAIIISIMISYVTRRVEEVPYLIVPTVLLTIVCLFTMIFSLLATRPTHKTRYLHNTSAGNLDLLFFGDFTELDQVTYREKVKEMIQDDERLYNGMIDNIYAQGKVLRRKYSLLNKAYLVFLVGLVLVVLSYALALLLFRG
jgi:hypothetical protein